MPAEFIVEGDQTTVIFSHTALTEKVKATLFIVAKKLFERGLGDHGDEDNPIVFDDLGNQDKLDIVFNYWLMDLRNTAKAQRRKEGEIAGGLAAELENEELSI